MNPVGDGNLKKSNGSQSKDFLDKKNPRQSCDLSGLLRVVSQYDQAWHLPTPYLWPA